MPNPQKSALVTFTGIADKGMAVGRTQENEVVFAKGPVPGDVAEVLLLKKRKGVQQGTIKEYIKRSPHRTEPICKHFDECGGCKWQHLSYEEQLRQKEIVVRDAFLRIARMEPESFLPILGSAETSYYRNKLEFSFSNQRWLTAADLDRPSDQTDQRALGFHAPGSFAKIVPVDHCHLQADPSNEIRNFVRDFTLARGYSYWDAKNNTGLMRNMIIRIASTGQMMLIVVFSKPDRTRIDELMEALFLQFPFIDSLFYVVNQKFNDSLVDQHFIHYRGKDHIIEKMGDLTFLISPKSFFQTNTRQSYKLYEVALEFAGLRGDETVYDLYTGIGSIGLFMAGKAKKVIGIELVEAAIADARINVRLNNIDSVEFIAGDVKDILSRQSERADLVMIDPPRAGMHPDLIATLLHLLPEKIIYVSCNPATQARDAAFLGEHYDLIRVRPVDMFPHTHHIESVALLQLKKG